MYQKDCRILEYLVWRLINHQARKLRDCTISSSSSSSQGAETPDVYACLMRKRSSITQSKTYLFSTLRAECFLARRALRLRHLCSRFPIRCLLSFGECAHDNNCWTKESVLGCTAKASTVLR